ncbi:hypothetical protein AC626_20385 [Pseudoalteromonas rubra]|uniref:Uncharacterized protein n=1 Tax=Pseudoalteromonas rubra TaxID=43658 RepID=A0A0L0END3_9GAMM|nr:hypothetical protein AC626_20385 [Pseudoalteromonas rubra]
MSILYLCILDHLKSPLLVRTIRVANLNYGHDVICIDKMFRIKVAGLHNVVMLYLLLNSYKRPDHRKNFHKNKNKINNMKFETFIYLT